MYFCSNFSLQTDISSVLENTNLANLKRDLEIKIESSFSLEDFKEIKKEKLPALDMNECIESVKRTDDHKSYLDFLICNENDYQCSICGVSKEKRRLLVEHLKWCHDEVPTYSCNHCSDKFLFQVKYDDHIIKNHEKNHKTFPDIDDRNEL